MEVRHKQEKRELLATAERMKREVPKKNKKKLKETNQLVAKMQKELALKQKLELELAAAGVSDADLAEAVRSKVQAMSVSEPTGDNTESQETGGAKAKGKAQRRREQQEETARLNKMVANTSAVNNPAPDHGKKEDEAFQLKLKPLGIQIQPIPADGDCLYAAIADQLKRHSRTVNGEVPTAALIRALAANHMRNSRDDFLPFCLNEDGDMVDSSGFDKYCQCVEHSKQWGGQLELRALAEALQTTVIVYQARSNEMPIEIPNSQEEPLLVSYHQHSYTLGAHYNSLLQTT